MTTTFVGQGIKSTNVSVVGLNLIGWETDSLG